MEIRPGIWQVQTDDALMKELDGWRARGRLLQFTFDKDLAKTYGAELISPGSYRLNAILELIRKQGILSHAHLPPATFHELSVRKRALADFGAAQRVYVVNSGLFYSQYFWLQFLISRHGLEKKESLHSAMVSLSSSEVLKFAVPANLFLAGPPPGQIKKRKISFKKAFESAVAECVAGLKRKDDSWAQEANQVLHKELAGLAAFYEQRTDEPEFALKTQAARRHLEPKVEIQALRGALLYIPLFHYRLIVVQPNGVEKTKNLYYDPVRNVRELD